MSYIFFRALRSILCGSLILSGSFIQAYLDPSEIATWSHDATAQHGTVDAKEQYQKLGHEALQLLNIKMPKTFCIKKLASYSTERDAAACNCGGIVFVNESYLDKQKKGLQRLTMLHEMVHLKQLLQNGYFKVCNKKYSSIEKEADIEAAKTGNCPYCTLEFAKKAASAQDTSEWAKKTRAKGYATKQELQEIASQQYNSQVCCPYHA